ncbi:hypothetical protein GWC95_00880 [Sediminibacterium roseum]|uniref:Uncharacterized protein n=1 Tax=Sediminibacterium roseum TaxID=1978412 RepID=A0ABW9ZTQ1_9BACT|nr:hypothetical protein [Sediminibacterium roseum]NCI48455.1 hypothetical protein [Sediminibacterium roseum]
MQKHLFHIVFLFIVGLLVVPAESYACGTKATALEKTKCKKAKATRQKASSSLAKHCCSSGNKHKECGKECGGRCGNSSACKCVASCNVPAAATLVQYIAAEPFTCLNDHPSLSRPAPVSPGFHFTWLPPKIG